MKKLIMLLVVAASAVTVNAAKIDWQFAETAKNTSNPYSLNGFTAYLFTSSDWTAALVDGITADTFADAVASKALDETAVGTTGVKWATGKQTWSDSAATDGQYYIVLADAGISKYLASNPLTATAYSDKETHTTASWSIGATATPIAATDFTAVPEPTSGLLILLGVAGLALKRKRA